MMMCWVCCQLLQCLLVHSAIRHQLGAVVQVVTGSAPARRTRRVVVCRGPEVRIPFLRQMGEVE